MDINEIEYADAAEHLVWADSYDYYVHTPSLVARDTFLYPLQTGLYRYRPGHTTERAAYDSFLIMYLNSGSFTFRTGERKEESSAHAGDFALLDCYTYHYYRALEESDVLWLHFDGKAARPYYDAIHARLGTTFALRNPAYAINRLARIHEVFADGERICEPVLGKTINDILCEMLAPENTIEADRRQEQDDIRRVVAYIGQHLDEPLPIADLAALAYMGEYNFIRVFKAQTGYTPHAYVMQARIDAAQYLLANTDAGLKEICAACGFSSPSVLCAAFKRKTGVSPLAFRRGGRPAAEPAEPAA
ncbi:AraC family transcriptional regulator [Bifidobacterium stellenboschense]|uniref:Transcriptional regulator, AraC family n=1 Tax=Bifidobacterium stellenboschense TaxID=762211 RepID=A0A087DT50_9BIFI|nr:AraC family transcriptional regulator [Bifidobacterium stellenboschense]KFI98700.1 transcriptional regulator, AraC family [Bifidobacterium stellenboschense]